MRVVLSAPLQLHHVQGRKAQLQHPAAALLAFATMSVATSAGASRCQGMHDGLPHLKHQPVRSRSR